MIKQFNLKTLGLRPFQFHATSLGVRLLEFTRSAGSMRGSDQYLARIAKGFRTGLLSIQSIPESSVEPLISSLERQINARLYLQSEDLAITLELLKRARTVAPEQVNRINLAIQKVEPGMRGRLDLRNFPEFMQVPLLASAPAQSGNPRVGALTPMEVELNRHLPILSRSDVTTARASGMHLLSIAEHDPVSFFSALNGAASGVIRQRAAIETDPLLRQILGRLVQLETMAKMASVRGPAQPFLDCLVNRIGPRLQ